MPLNGSGIRDIARVLQVGPTTVSKDLKKSSRTLAGKQSRGGGRLSGCPCGRGAARGGGRSRRDGEFREEQSTAALVVARHCSAHRGGAGLSARQPSRGGVLTVTKVTQALGLVHFYTDAAGGYDRPLPATHTIGKAYTHQSERHHLTLRTRIQRLARQTSGFSQSGFMPDTVIGLFVNHYEFGTPV